MQVETTRFGMIDVDPESIIRFPSGIPGFPGCQKFKLLHEQGRQGVHWLQSLDDPDVSLSVVVPHEHDIYFEFILSDEEEKQIGLGEDHGLLLLMMLYEPTLDVTSNANDPLLWDNVHARIAAPLVINTETRLALQKRLKQVERRIVIREATPINC